MKKNDLIAAIHADKQQQGEQMRAEHERRKKAAAITVKWWLKDMGLKDAEFEMITDHRFNLTELDIILLIGENDEIYHATGSRVTYIKRPADLYYIIAHTQ